ncbi:MAG: hypothetical protein JXR94_24700 [Candidatus Hydrogenedentes bacterium]|nr:hypothetical protein [Candidatus Hydrogenedentota bacterium]
MNWPVSLRFRLKWLWWKHCWRFHWAHKPWCPRYAGDVLRLGSLRLCRSCLAAYTGMAVAAAAILLRPQALRLNAGIYAAWLAATLALSAPPLYARVPRLGRDALRCSAGALVPFAVGLLIAVHPGLGAAAVAGMALAWHAFRRLREPNRRAACAGCPDLVEGRVCPGYAEQAAQIRRYEAEASALIAALGVPPGIPPASRKV